MRKPATASRPAPTNEETLAQVQALLDDSTNDFQSVLLKEMIAGVLKLKDARLDTLDIKILNRTHTRS